LFRHREYENKLSFPGRTGFAPAGPRLILERLPPIDGDSFDLPVPEVDFDLQGAEEG
jgi:hypothetical protein